MPVTQVSAVQIQGHALRCIQKADERYRNPTRHTGKFLYRRSEGEQGKEQKDSQRTKEVKMLTLHPCCDNKYSH